jgi:hypothetical protein
MTARQLLISCSLDVYCYGLSLRCGKKAPVASQFVSGKSRGDKSNWEKREVFVLTHGWAARSVTRAASNLSATPLSIYLFYLMGIFH